MGKYAKGIAAVLTAGLIAAQNAFPLTAQHHAWITVALALLGSVAVYQVPNASSETTTARHQVGE
jgi:hypothetical protein